MRTKASGRGTIPTTDGDTAALRSLECHGVGVYRGGVKALDDVSIRVDVGEIVGLIGPNGAGKTTLLDALSGFLARMSGGVTINGVDVSRESASKRSRRGIHRTFQGSRLFANLSVEENVMVGVLAGGRSASTARSECDELLASLELDRWRRERCQGLPQGITQRIVLARALATRPQYLMLDEPAAGLSEVETEEFEHLLRGARESGTGVLVVEHDMRFVESVCDRIYVLSEGALLFEGTVADTFVSPVVQQAYLGEIEH